MGLLVIGRTPARAALAPKNCLAFKLPDGQLLRVWVQPHQAGKVRCVIDAPGAVQVLRGEVLGDAAHGPLPSS